MNWGIIRGNYSAKRAAARIPAITIPATPVHHAEAMNMLQGTQIYHIPPERHTFTVCYDSLILMKANEDNADVCGRFWNCMKSVQGSK